MQGIENKLVLTVEELSKRLGARLLGAGSANVSGIRAIHDAGSSEVTFLSNLKHLSKLGSSKAAAVIVSREIKDCRIPQLVVRDVNAALIEAAGIFAPRRQRQAAGVHPSAIVAEGARIEASASIGPLVIIEDGVEVGAGTVIGAGCRIEGDCSIGRDCRIGPNVVIYPGCELGNNVVVQANTTIGSCGFGYAVIDGAPRLIPHNGGVIIEDFVEIGANCCIDRAKFANTVIGAGTKIDNLVQIAHNVIIGKCCLIAAQVGIGGSCEIGNNVVLGGQVGVTDGVKIGDGTVVGGKSGVTHNLPGGGQFAWIPAVEVRKGAKQIAFAKRLPKVFEQLEKLVKRVDKLEAAKNDT